jgi:hypothetical protein
MENPAFFAGKLGALGRNVLEGVRQSRLWRPESRAFARASEKLKFDCEALEHCPPHHHRRWFCLHSNYLISSLPGGIQQPHTRHTQSTLVGPPRCALSIRSRSAFRRMMSIFPECKMLPRQERCSAPGTSYLALTRRQVAPCPESDSFNVAPSVQRQVGRAGIRRCLHRANIAVVQGFAFQVEVVCLTDSR